MILRQPDAQRRRQLEQRAPGLVPEAVSRPVDRTLEKACIADTGQAAELIKVEAARIGAVFRKRSILASGRCPVPVQSETTR
jgi:hypothetical protein